ncbi:MAG: methylornithine synthase PylB [Clostridiales bacterium]|nr:methylornithine synthase PylB [Clostridiales bacterium]
MPAITREDVYSYLINSVGSDELFASAREMRRQVFGDKIFMYGFVYFSTWCRNNCNFCYFRRDNNIERYRKPKDEVLKIAMELADSGVNLIDLTMGEDPAYHSDGFEDAVSIVWEIKKRGVPVMVSPGVVGEEVIDRFSDAGADWFALYQETHNRELFAKLRVRQDFDERMECKRYARRKGLLIEEGILAGVGESEGDIAESLMQMGDIGASQVRVMSFVPQVGSPMENAATPDRIKEYKIIALMRLLYPYALIPASLDVDGIAGLRKRIEAGANVVTSIIPPRSGLMGVAQCTMDVDEGGRTFSEAAAVLEGMGLRAASRDEYKECIGGLK